MAFIGIYSTETYELMAFADREHISPSVDNTECDPMELAVEIPPNQVHAIIRHIRTADNCLTQINITGLHFVCLRNGTGCMTGMSNFNIDTTQSDILKERGNVLYSIVHKHYTSQELLEESHALQISAILKEHFIIIALCRSGTESSLNILKNVFKEPKNRELVTETNTHSKKTDISESAECDDTFDTYNTTCLNTEVVEEAGESEDVFAPDDIKCLDIEMVELGDTADQILATKDYSHENYTNNTFSQSDVDLRPSALSDDEKQLNQRKRETSFCEDWRTATVRSIEALKIIGPFRDDDFSDRDDRPLINPSDSIDTYSASHATEGSESYFGNTEEDAKSRKSTGDSKAKDGRRPSRATMV